MAAALVRAPNARPALVAQRACGVLREMQAVGVGAPAVQASPGGQGRAAAAPVQATRVECDALALFTEGALQRRLGRQRGRGAALCPPPAGAAGAGRAAPARPPP